MEATDSSGVSAEACGATPQGRRSARACRATVLAPGVPISAVAVQAPVVFRRADDALHVVLRLREWDVVDELVTAQARTIAEPADDAILARVVGGERRHDVAELLHEVLEVRHADAKIRLWIRQAQRRESANP